MKKRFFSGLVCCVAAAFGTLFAQEAPQVPQLPQDTALVTGVLDNGLTYYIRHNETPRGQADFYIAQKVGSILEEDNQRGLAHFLEHMCFNGTENFPGKKIIEWLESVGVKFGRNLNAYTSIDETVYNISNVPVARTSVQDSCLLILHDWANALTLAGEEIDAERGVIHEEWRSRNVGSSRILENLLPTIYAGNRYGYRMPIGTMEVVDNFEHQALIDYYHKWYRPDQQAVIVVGDIDPAYIEAKIKELFAPIPMPADAAERVYFEVDDTPGTIYAIGSDTEMEVADVMMFFKSDEILLPREMRNTQMYYMIEYLQRMASMMLNTRLSDLAKTPECDYAQARVSIGDFFLAKTKGALTLDVIAKNENVVEAFAEAYREVLRADRTGFTVGEYERASSEFISQVDKIFNERKSRENESYSEEYVRLFVDNIPAPGIELEKQLFDQFAQMINVDMVNQYFQSLVQDDNRVLVAFLPKKEGFTEPTENQFAEAIDNIDNEELEAYKDEVRTDPLIPSLPAAGSVVSTAHNDTWDATEYTLSNGVKVVVKHTDFKANEILFQASALGKGLSTLDQSKAPSILFGEVAMSRNALNDYSNSDLQKYLAGKQVNVEFSYSTYSRDMEGSTTVADLPTLMEMIYAWFTGVDLKESEFAATQDMYAGILANQESNPQFTWLKKVLETLYQASSRHNITAADVRAANRADIVEMYRNMLANAADYTFYFVGDIDETTFVPLMEQYIATLPADKATASREFTVDPAFEVRAGQGEDVVTSRMETPQSWVFIAFSGNMPYTAKNRALTTVASQVLSKRLLDKVREEMGATYSIGAGANMSRVNGTNTMFQIPFPMKPEFRQEVLPIIKDIVNAMATEVTAEEIRPAIEYIGKTSAESLEKNEGWLGAMVAYDINGVQTFTNAAEVAAGITPADVQDYMRELLAQGNYRVIILDPEVVAEETAE